MPEIDRMDILFYFELLAYKSSPKEQLGYIDQVL
ncbi:hypothetical protein ABH899_004938 [Paenibacillus sp. RC84]